MFRRFAVGVAAVALVLGAVSVSSANVKPRMLTAPVGHIVPAHGHLLTSPQGMPVINNTDFAGYAATPKSGGASAFKYVTASFTVPSLNCPSAGNGDLQLANLGSNGVLNFGYAIGVTSVCQSGYVQYQGWYWTPSSAHGAIDVNPGDAVTASVSYNSTNKTYTLKLLDHTTGQKTDVTQKSSVKSTVAEVVTVGEGGSNDGMADFAAVHFDTIKVNDTSGDHSGLVNLNWTTDELVAFGPISGQLEAQPGPLYGASPPAQSAFETTWLRGS